MAPVNGFTFLEDVVVRISVDECGDVADDQALIAIGDVNKRIEEIDRLLFVFWNMLTRGIERERTR